MYDKASIREQRREIPLSAAEAENGMQRDSISAFRWKMGEMDLSDQLKYRTCSQESKNIHKHKAIPDFVRLKQITFARSLVLS